MQRDLSFVKNRLIQSIPQARCLTTQTKKYPRPLRTKKHGIDVLHDPLWNKSMAFDMSERDRLGLRGLLPPTIRSLELQVKRNVERLRALPNDISKNLYLQDLHNRNETLYHRLLVDHVRDNPVLSFFVFSNLTKRTDEFPDGRNGTIGLHSHRWYRM
eukprot:scaffold2799_cov159-Ochromonas_danica.AAC.20